MHAAHVAPIELFERAHVATARTSNQIEIIGFGLRFAAHRQWHGEAGGTHGAGLDALRVFKV